MGKAPWEKLLDDATSKGPAASKPIPSASGDRFADMEDDLLPAAPIAKKPAKKQTTRLRLIECAPCNYKLRGTLGAFDRCGIPRCPGCKRQMKLVMIEDT